mgnify:CR=1 FL=1
MYNGKMQEVGKLLAFLGLVFLVLGLVINIVPSLGWYKMPGDIYIKRPGIKIYIPVTSALIVSAILTLLFNFFIG